MKNILKKLSGGADIFLGLIGFVGILVITANAFCRFVLKVPMSWSDEFLRTIMVYGYFIGAALMFCTGGAMRLEIMDNALKGHPVGHRILNILLAIVNTGFFGLMTVYVIQMIVQYMVTGTTQSTSMGYPAGLCHRYADHHGFRRLQSGRQSDPQGSGASG